MKVKIGSIVVYCCEFDKMLAFWQQALRYVPRDPFGVVKPAWPVLLDPFPDGAIVRCSDATSHILEEVGLTSVVKPRVGGISSRFMLNSLCRKPSRCLPRHRPKKRRSPRHRLFSSALLGRRSIWLGARANAAFVPELALFGPSAVGITTMQRLKG